MPVAEKILLLTVRKRIHTFVPSILFDVVPPKAENPDPVPVTATVPQVTRPFVLYLTFKL